jgi:hypothetical protein
MGGVNLSANPTENAVLLANRAYCHGVSGYRHLPRRPITLLPMGVRRGGEMSSASFGHFCHYLWLASPA